VPVLHFHGTKDEYTPFLGGKGERSLSGTHFHSVEHSIKTWVKLNGCDENPKIELLSKVDDEMKVTRTTYAKGRNGAEVALVVIDGGGHTWPGMPPPTKVLGKSALNISANDLMWAFFEKHKLTHSPTTAPA
jgi:polyhydroxybutyrate depolymerase